mgnify:FL=1
MKSLRSLLLILACLAACAAPVDDVDGDEIEEPTPVYDARVWLSPASGSAGVPRTVSIWGQGTEFAQGFTSVDFGEGIETQVLLIDSSFHARAQILIAAGAALGPRDVTVTWGDGQQRIVRDGFVVETGSLDISPRGAALGETVQVEVTGWGTEFTPGLTLASLGPGVEMIGGVDVLSSSRLQFVAHIDPRADVGPRDLVAYNGPTVWTLQNAFHIDRTDRTMSIAPDEAFQSQTLEVRIDAEDAAFVDEETVLDMGTGIVIEDVEVIDAEHLAARIRVGNNARVGERDVAVSTLTEDGPVTRMLIDGFTVHGVEANPLRARVSLSYSASRLWDAEQCGYLPRLTASALFYEPNDFPCPSSGSSSTLSAPARFDIPSTGFSQPAGGATDCPAVKTFDAGPFVYFEGEEGTVTLARQVAQTTGRVTYRAEDLTVADYVEDTFFSLRTEGGDLGENELPAWEIPEALRSLPRDFELTDPDWCNLVHPLTEPLELRWTPAQTYDVADMYVYVTGPPQQEGIPLLFMYPWDDGAYTLTPNALSFFTSGYSEVTQVAVIRSRFEVPGSEYPLAGIASSASIWRGDLLFE